MLAGNPVFAGTTAMTRETGINVCGLCHGHYGFKQVARTIGIDPEKVTWQAPGLNHNIWLTDFFYEGEDIYPQLDTWIDSNIELYWKEKEKDGGIPCQMSPSAIHQYRMYGLMPIGDTPRSGGWWYNTDLETRARWFGVGGGGDTPAGRDKILKGQAKKFQQMKEAAFDDAVRPIDLFGDTLTPEAHIPIMDEAFASFALLLLLLLGITLFPVFLRLVARRLEDRQLGLIHVLILRYAQTPAHTSASVRHTSASNSVCRV